jgi:hypothetical protein
MGSYYLKNSKSTFLFLVDTVVTKIYRDLLVNEWDFCLSALHPMIFIDLDSRVRRPILS